MRLYDGEVSSATSALTEMPSSIGLFDDGRERRWGDQTSEQRDLYTQFVISIALGLGAFLAFCVCLSANHPSDIRVFLG